MNRPVAKRARHMPKTIVIVGGGFGGVECARRLQGKLPPDWQVVLFSDRNHTTFTPLLAEVVGSSISPLHVVWTIRQMLRKTVCRTAEISKIDFAANEGEYRLGDGRQHRCNSRCSGPFVPIEDAGRCHHAPQSRDPSA